MPLSPDELRALEKLEPLRALVVERAQADARLNRALVSRTNAYREADEARARLTDIDTRLEAMAAEVLDALKTLTPRRNP